MWLQNPGALLWRDHTTEQFYLTVPSADKTQSGNSVLIAAQSTRAGPPSKKKKPRKAWGSTAHVVFCFLYLGNIDFESDKKTAPGPALRHPKSRKNMTPTRKRRPHGRDAISSLCQA